MALRHGDVSTLGVDLTEVNLKHRSTLIRLSHFTADIFNIMALSTEVV